MLPIVGKLAAKWQVDNQVEKEILFSYREAITSRKILFSIIVEKKRGESLQLEEGLIQKIII